jgi:gamma-D-glutamyl-L-lysine dipeptidyl-peptidase
MDLQEYGVCRLSVVSVRSEPQGHSPLVNQLLFGDHYEVVQTTGDAKWVNIRVFADQSEGWITAAHHHGITPEYFEYINKVEFKVALDLSSVMLYKKLPVSIVMGSIVPISSSELFATDEQFAFTGESKSLGQKRDFDFLKTIALKYLNAPHLPGGKTPFGIDAAAFIQMVFKLSGYPLKRTTEAMLDQGKRVTVSEACPGDVLFFQTSKGLHPGIVLDNHRLIHVRDWVVMETLSGPMEVSLDDQQTKMAAIEVRRFLAPAR